MELVVTVVIMATCFVAILDGTTMAIRSSTLARQQSTVETVLNSMSEAMKMGTAEYDFSGSPLDPITVSSPITGLTNGEAVWLQKQNPVEHEVWTVEGVSLDKMSFRLLHRLDSGSNPPSGSGWSVTRLPTFTEVPGYTADILSSEDLADPFANVQKVRLKVQSPVNSFGNRVAMELDVLRWKQP